VVRSTAINPRFVATVCERLAQNKPVRRALPGGGRLHIDRQLPFLCVYRQPRHKDIGTAELVLSEASYLIAPGDKRLQADLALLVTDIAKTLINAYGAFLLVEVWAMRDDQSAVGSDTHKPTFKIVVPRRHALPSTVAAFERALRAVTLEDQGADVQVASATRAWPAQSPSLLPPDAAQLGCHMLGIEVRPVYRDPATAQLLPPLHQALRQRLSRAYKRGLFAFVRKHTRHRPPHFLALGRRALVKAVWTVDQQLAEVSNHFDLILAATPVNGDAAWSAFRRSRYEREPEFNYRPLQMDPPLLKRRLFAIPIERIEDPTLANLFGEQQIELDRKISMLADRGTPNFLYSSLQLFGSVDDDLLRTAEAILSMRPGRPRNDAKQAVVNAGTVAAQAEEELNYLRLTQPEINTRVEVRDDIIGLMVSRGNLLVGSQTKVPAGRMAALLAHEIGTHVVTYLNGRAQPFKQLFVGLPGYEELQEGMAVFAEYLVGGLNRARIRLLAARVVAVRSLLDGASFVDGYRELNQRYGFPRRAAYNITLRIFRGGGLTKDAVYLRGLMRLLDYLGTGGQFETLYVGKLAVQHVPIIRELQLRQVLKPLWLRPRYMDDMHTVARLARARDGLSVLDLAKECSP